MVTKNQVQKYKKKLNINNEEPPGVFLKGDDGKIRDIETGEVVPDEERHKSSLPDVIFVRGEENSNKKSDEKKE